MIASTLENMDLNNAATNLASLNESLFGNNTTSSAIDNIQKTGVDALSAFENAKGKLSLSTFYYSRLKIDLKLKNEKT